MIAVGTIITGTVDLGAPTLEAWSAAHADIMETRPPDEWAAATAALELPNETLTLRFRREDADMATADGFTLLCPGCDTPLPLTIAQLNATAPLSHECGWSFPFVFDGPHAGPAPLAALVDAINTEGGWDA